MDNIRFARLKHDMELLIRSDKDLMEKQSLINDLDPLATNSNIVVEVTFKLFGQDSSGSKVYTGNSAEFKKDIIDRIRKQFKNEREKIGTQIIEAAAELTKLQNDDEEKNDNECDSSN